MSMLNEDLSKLYVYESMMQGTRREKGAFMHLRGVR
jgi:hypothetical protein